MRRGVGERLRRLLELRVAGPQVLAALRPADGIRRRERPVLLPRDVQEQRSPGRHRFQRELRIRQRGRRLYSQDAPEQRTWRAR